MSVNPLTPVRLLPRPELPLEGMAQQATPMGSPAVSPAGGGNFGDLLSNMMESVNSLEGEAGNAQKAMMNGEATDLHQVMIAAEEAGVSLDLLMEIRNKLVEGYQEILRMPI